MRKRGGLQQAGAVFIWLGLVLAVEWAAASETPPASPAPPPAGAVEKSPWSLTIGGYVKLDAIHDFDAIASTDNFDPRTIPIDGAEGTNTRLHARETRLSLAMVGPVEGHDLRLFVETDFYGSGNSLRLRHGYAEYRGWLAGQTWSTFMDETNIPPTVDFETPLAAPFQRTAMLRFSHRVAEHATLAAAIEESDPEVVAPPGVEGKTEKPVPDLTARVRWSGDAGHFQVAGFLGQSRFRPQDGEPIDDTLWGVSLSGRYRPFGHDAAYAQAAYGPGLGRYRGGVTTAPDASGELEAAEVSALTVGYQHRWAPRWTTNVVWSAAELENEVGGPEVNQRLVYAAANLLWWFLPDRAWAGIELLHGDRDVRSGASGSADRIHLGIRFNLPSFDVGKRDGP